MLRWVEQTLNAVLAVQAARRYCWQTNNELTVPVSGTGSAAMEVKGVGFNFFTQGAINCFEQACFANLVEPGDKVLIASNGYFGSRMADMAERYDFKGSDT